MDRPEPAERLVFSSVVEGLLKHGLGGELPPPLKEQLKVEGIDVDRPLLPAYPVLTWERSLQRIADHYYPGMDREQAFRTLGKQMADGYASTFIGKALYALMRLIGPTRTLKRMAQNLGASDNYTNVALIEHSPTDFTMKMNAKIQIRGYAEGLFVTMLESAGAKGVEVQESARTEDGVEYRIRWAG